MEGQGQSEVEVSRDSGDPVGDDDGGVGDEGSVPVPRGEHDLAHVAQRGRGVGRLVQVRDGVNLIQNFIGAEEGVKLELRVHRVAERGDTDANGVASDVEAANHVLHEVEDEGPVAALDGARGVDEEDDVLLFTAHRSCNQHEQRVTRGPGATRASRSCASDRSLGLVPAALSKTQGLSGMNPFPDQKSLQPPFCKQVTFFIPQDLETWKSSTVEQQRTSSVTLKNSTVLPGKL